VATVTIIVGSELDTPVATDDAFQVDEDSELTVPKETGVLANDSDPDDGDLTATVITQPSHGTLGASAPDGSFHYEPFLDFNGIDLFTYEAENQSGKASTGRVTILVGAQGDIVIATDDHYQVSEGVSLTVPAPGILSNDIDSDGDKLGLSVVEGVAHGKLELNQDGSFLYAPAASFNGSDGFTYRVKDSDGNQATAKVAIAVRPADKPPPDEPTTMPPVAPPPPPPPPPPAVEIKTITPPAPVDLPEPDAPVVPITVPAPAPPPPPTVALLPQEEKKGREVPVKPLAAAGGGGVALAGLLAGLASRRRHALGPLDDSPL
ncbi:MAG: Ig-like domain-containing protein, partial [Acidimicrobiia bacterium]